MTPDIPKRNFEPGQPLCINRKIHNSEIKARQAAFVDRFAQGCNGALVSSQEAALTPIEHPYVIRGMKFTAAVNLCWQTARRWPHIIGLQHSKGVHPPLGVESEGRHANIRQNFNW